MCAMLAVQGYHGAEPLLRLLEVCLIPPQFWINCGLPRNHGSLSPDILWGIVLFRCLGRRCSAEGSNRVTGAKGGQRSMQTRGGRREG